MVALRAQPSSSYRILRNVGEADHRLAGFVHFQAQLGGGLIPRWLRDETLNILQVTLGLSKDALIDAALGILQLLPDRGASLAIGVTEGGRDRGRSEESLLGEIASRRERGSRSSDDCRSSALKKLTTIHLHRDASSAGSTGLEALLHQFRQEIWIVICTTRCGDIHHK